MVILTRCTPEEVALIKFQKKRDDPQRVISDSGKVSNAELRTVYTLRESLTEDSCDRVKSTLLNFTKDRVNIESMHNCIYQDKA